MTESYFCQFPLAVVNAPEHISLYEAKAKWISETAVLAVIEIAALINDFSDNLGGAVVDKWKDTLKKMEDIVWDYKFNSVVKCAEIRLRGLPVPNSTGAGLDHSGVSSIGNVAEELERLDTENSKEKKKLKQVEASIKSQIE